MTADNGAATTQRRRQQQRELHWRQTGSSINVSGIYEYIALLAVLAMSVCMNRTVTHERFLYKLRHFSNKYVYKVISRGVVELLTDLRLYKNSDS